MTLRFEADGNAALRQAWMTAAEYMDAAVREIDGKLGHGYAAKNPQLIAMFMQTAARDYHSSVTLSAAQIMEEALISVTQIIVTSLESGKERDED